MIFSAGQPVPNLIEINYVVAEMKCADG